MKRSRRVRRLPGGKYRVRLPAAERLLLMVLSTHLATILGSEEPYADPSMRRLFPPAYVDDEDAERSYQDLVRGDLVAQRARALNAVDHVTHSPEVDDEEMAAFLAALNSLRLVIGTHLDVSENLDDLETEGGFSSSTVGAYTYLSWLEGQVVDAMSASLPPSTDTST